ncbi:alpha/beta fold hydrolase [Pseudooceanicola sp. 200-1SW]|uniref:alpha/beta fold hydrolase n=1 Tax=Pseudooceanicola sp. 200-1SW TaxID=3425949 RepID=UPI003D7F77E9
MARFVLVHGSCHTARCWQELIQELTRLGHGARALDLPGRGADRRPPDALTLRDGAEEILQGIEEAPAILVAHSAGGYPAGLAAELAPEKVARLVFLCAYVPRDGASVVDRRKESVEQPLMPALRRGPPGTYAFDPAQSPALFCHDVAPDVAARAVAALVPEPVRPQSDPIRVTERYGSVPKSYIRCTQDRAIPPAHQTLMAAAIPEKDRYDMPTSHSPFLADPAGLAALLHRIAGGV